MQMKLADLFDTTSILQLKVERLKGITDAERSEYIEEYKKCREEVGMYPYLNHLYQFLYLINGWIWTLESDLRRGVLDETSDEGLRGIGETTVKIRDNNKLRIYLKNQITSIVKDGVIEIKGDHRSAIEGGRTH